MVKTLFYNIIGAAMRVHKIMGYGLLEAVYQEALSLELKDNGIDNEIEKELHVYYKHHLLQKYYKMDLVVDDIVCELKVVSHIIPVHRAQLCNYLRLARKPYGLLINFGGRSLQGERWAYDVNTNECYLIDVNMQPLPMNDIEIDYETNDEIITG